VKDNTGFIMNIQNFSVNDGEGIRSTIFMAGCPLRCKWCSNPESWSFDNDYVREMTLDDVVEEIRKNMIFYRYSQGGITYSGGEPTFQSDFLRAMVDTFYDMGIHQTIETCGYFNWEQVEDIFKKLDFIFVDIKVMDGNKHKELTGLDNEIILKNIKRLGKLNVDLVVRIPLIKDINDSLENIKETASFVKDNIGNGKIEILPYHSLGAYKYDKLGLSKYKNIFKTPSKEEILNVKRTIESYGLEIVDFK